MQNSSHQPGSATWSTPPQNFSGHQRSSSSSRYPEADRREEGYPDQAYASYQNQGYNPSALNYYPNQTTSNPKSSTPPTSAPPAANTSPSSQYYARPNEYPSSQPQTAHPYGSGAYYQNYYDYAPNYPRQPSGSTTTPTLPQTPVLGDRTDYSPSYQYDPRYQARQQQYYPQHQQAQQQQQHQQQQQQHQQQQQYFQWPGSYGYPPAQQPPAQAAAPQPVSAPAAAAAPAGKKKKEKKEEATGTKRPAEDVDESDEKEKSSKKKKGKKEEPVVPKPPAKSHLHPPRQAQSAWQLFFTDELNKAKAAAQTGASPGGTPYSAKLNVAQIAKDAGAAYGALNDEQKVYYAQKVQESKDQYAKDLVAWQATLTPEDIRLENAFRAQQRKDGKSRKGNLKDPNAPKKPLSAYFLFLKSIREDDELRARVWGDETETTKQSVLAAERWRGLTDVEKKPYLQKAEKDKQDYEGARKVYEEDAAARARGEDVPDRPPLDAHATPLEIPQSLKQDKKELDFSPTGQFAGFHDPLDGMGLSGLDGDTQQWGDLHHLMEDKDGVKAEKDTTKEDELESKAFESMSAFLADPE